PERIGDESLTWHRWLFVHRNIWGFVAHTDTISLVTAARNAWLSGQKLTFPRSREQAGIPQKQKRPPKEPLCQSQLSAVS
uniref:hypothetical protein n=1 Tax=uncultured Hoeflea sp. TaxID=538666 RepID=UPI0030DA0178